MNHARTTIEALELVLQNQWGPSESGDEYIVFTKYGLQISVMPNVVISPDSAVAHIDFLVTHPSFDEPIFDTSSSVGEKADDAIGKAVFMFIQTILDSIKLCLDREKPSAELASTLDGKLHEWNVYFSNIVGIGNSDEVDNINFFEELLPYFSNHLGTRKMCWVKIFAALINGEITSEVRFNNFVSAELSTALHKLIETWSKDTNFVTKKQVLFFEQKDSTYKRYPYTKIQIEELACQAVEILGSANTDEKYQNRYQDLLAVTNDPHLAQELMSFIPEICAELHFDEVWLGEKFGVAKENDTLEVYMDQFTCYRWIQERVIKGFVSGEFSSELYKEIIYSSATLNVINQATEAGSELKDLTISVSMNVDEDYQVR